MWQNIMWQEIIVGLCVLAALAFLLRRWLFGRKASGSCGSCSGCSTPSCSTPGDKHKAP